MLKKGISTNTLLFKLHTYNNKTEFFFFTMLQK